MLRVLTLLLTLSLTGCPTQGNWIPTIWGGEVLEGGTIEFDDGCTVTIDSFVVSILQGALLTPEGTASAVLPGNQLFDLVPPGPQSMASIDVRKGPYPDTVYFLGAAVEPGPDTLVGRGQLTGVDNAASDLNPIVGNATAAQRDAMIEAGAAALVQGTIDCPVAGVPAPRTFAWLLTDDDGVLRCPNPDLEVVGGSFGASMLAVAGEGLFPDADGSVMPLWAAGNDGEILLEALETAGLTSALLQRLRWLFAAEEPCTWEELEEL